VAAYGRRIDAPPVMRLHHLQWIPTSPHFIRESTFSLDSSKLFAYFLSEQLIVENASCAPGCTLQGKAKPETNELI